MELTRLQTWAQIGHRANQLKAKNDLNKGKWEAYYDALVLLGPAPLVLVDARNPYGRFRHPTLGDPGDIPGAING